MINGNTKEIKFAAISIAKFEKIKMTIDRKCLLLNIKKGLINLIYKRLGIHLLRIEC